jgi:hypothetical protein
MRTMIGIENCDFEALCKYEFNPQLTSCDSLEIRFYFALDENFPKIDELGQNHDYNFYSDAIFQFKLDVPVVSIGSTTNRVRRELAKLSPPKLSDRKSRR